MPLLPGWLSLPVRFLTARLVHPARALFFARPSFASSFGLSVVVPSTSDPSPRHLKDVGASPTSVSVAPTSCAPGAPSFMPSVATPSPKPSVPLRRSRAPGATHVHRPPRRPRLRVPSSVSLALRYGFLALPALRPHRASPCARLRPVSVLRALLRVLPGLFSSAPFAL